VSVITDCANVSSAVSCSLEPWLVRTLPCDVPLGDHGATYGMQAKYAKLKAGGPNPFIDPAGYHAYLAERQRAFQAEWDKQKAAAK